jgi:hypothetical protein
MLHTLGDPLALVARFMSAKDWRALVLVDRELRRRLYLHVADMVDRVLNNYACVRHTISKYRATYEYRIKHHGLDAILQDCLRVSAPAAPDIDYTLWCALSRRQHRRLELFLSINVLADGATCFLLHAPTLEQLRWSLLRAVKE